MSSSDLDKKTDEQAASSAAAALCLHDCLSLGEVELGLLRQDNGTTVTHQAVEEIQRLPLFLRVLSLTRPLASISILEDDDSKKKEGGDPLVNRAVERLEHVAATYSVAEGVDVVTCHLAPSVSRKLSKLPPLVKKAGDWDTKALAAVARNPRSSKRKRSNTKNVSSNSEQPQSERADGIGGSSDEDDDDGEEDEEEMEHQSLPNTPANKKQRQKTLLRRDSMEFAEEDSQEATVTKTLSELTSLVITSLEPISDDQDTEEEQKGKTISLTIDDSILSESAGYAAQGAGGAMEGSDLGSTVAAIMHHAPVLRSKHVANALCRAAIPQAGNLLTRMGANCPASVPSLLLGCVQAYSLAISHGSTSIANVAKKGATALAKLSPTECSRVQNKLMSLGVMLDVQLKLAMETGATSAACLLVQNLSDNGKLPASWSGTERKDKDSTKDTSSRQKSEQHSGDASSDFRTREMYSNYIPKGKEPLLWQLLTTDMTLYRQTLEFFSSEFSSLATTTEKVPMGKLCLLLRACGWLLLVPTKKAVKFDPSEYLLESLIPELTSLMECLKRNVPQSSEVSEKSTLDNALKLLHCSVVLASARILGGDEQSEEATGKCKEMMNCMHGFPSVSRSSDGSRFILKSAINNENLFGLFIHIINIFSNKKVQDTERPKGLFPSIESGLKKVCELAKKESAENVCDDKVDVSSRLSTLLLEMQEGSGQDEDGIISRTKEMLISIIVDDKTRLSPLIQDDNVARFVVDATVFLSVKGGLLVPLVLPSQLDLLGSKLIFDPRREGQPPNDLESQFLLQLLHSFEYLDQEPKSPFVFDPRSSPIKEALRMSKALSTSAKRHYLECRLQDHAGKLCPEALSHAQRLELQNGEVTWTLFDSMSRREIMDSLHVTIRSFVEDLKPDEAGYSMEGIFVQAKSRLSDADLCSTVVISLLATPHKPSPCYTYPLLCRDPLVIFKVPMKVWRCKGLRRIVLTILCSLLESNAAIITSASPVEDSSEELIAAGNAMVVRCLLVAMSGVEGEVSGSYCSMTTSVIRSLVSGHHGLVALLIKQGLPEKALDWLVEFVPETMNDSRELLQMLSARSSLTTAERLVAADAIIRIAIVHGHINEIEAATMAYTALAQLIDSFFLVVGPVGVPVNALIADDSGLDVTQISRNAAFRILKSLLRVRGRRTRLRQECGMALQKVANLCKGESAVAGVAGAVAGRRKIFLKEIFDAAMKADNAMGGALGSQSAAA